MPRARGTFTPPTNAQVRLAALQARHALMDRDQR